MKKAILIALLFAAVVLTACLFGTAGAGENSQTAAYLRVHIRANSNGADDQAVKYEVRDGVVEYLTPVVAECETKAAAVDTIEARLGEIETVAERILEENGYSYGARASILELGTGEGDNWWCVVYPPLCFTGGRANVVYKSKILEIIQNFFK